MAEVFISYAREDRAIAQAFADALEAAGYVVWWDMSLLAGEAFDMRIEAAIKSANAVIVLWSESSVNSRWVRAEATLADRLGTLVPVRIGACELPIIFELTHTIDLSGWAGDRANSAWETLLQAVQTIAGDATGATGPGATGPGANPGSVAEQVPETPSADTPSVLILPFVNMSGDHEQEYFADGVTEDIITDLSKVAALKVASRKASFAWKGKAPSRDDAVAAGATHLLEGSIRKSGEQIRITAELTDAASEARVWAERYDRTLQDIFAIQDDISKAIVTALKVQLAPAERDAIEQRMTTSPEAYDLFVMARQFSRTGSERMYPIIDRICKRVVELDPQFAAAWALMGLIQSEMWSRRIPGTSRESAESAARKALEIDDRQPLALAAMAEVFGRGDDMNLAVGEPYVLKALEIDPDCYEANLFAGYLFLGQHEFEKAARALEKAIDLEPRGCRAPGMAIEAYISIGRPDLSQAAARLTLERCEKLLEVEPDHASALGFYVNALAFLGEKDRARDWARRAQIFHPDNHKLQYNLACGLVELGDHDKAIDCLESVVQEVGEGWLIWMDRDPCLNAIHGQDRYEEMMKAARNRLAAEEDKGSPKRPT